jgi:pimeloyl-ACP methyl ester carboxylesterase
MPLIDDTVTSPDGTTIAFDRSGDGPPVVLVGGAFQHRVFDSRTQELAQRLSATHTVLHYDRRGRGDSTDASAPPPYDPEREIEDLGAVIEAAGGSAAVFGMSSGAVLALDAAAAGLPIRVLAVYEPPFVVDGGRVPTPGTYRAALTDLIAQGRRGDAVELCLTQAVGVPAPVVAQMRQAPIWPAFEGVAHTLPYDAALMDGTQQGEPLPRGRWAGVDLPVLVADGGASEPYVAAAADALAQVLAHARRETLQDQTHDVAPAVLAPVLASFLAG